MEAQGIGREHMIKCAHRGCSCLVEPSQSYCSEHCAREAKTPGSYNLPGGTESGGPCRCGHPDCEGTAAGGGTGRSGASH